MTGKSHRAIGVASGIALSIYSLRCGAPLGLLSLITAPLGAILPDIDHDGSVAGKVKNKILNYLWVVIAIVFIGVCTFITLTYGAKDILIYIGLLTSICILCFITWKIINKLKPKPAQKKTQKNKVVNTVKQEVEFLTEHRGIMHTMLVPGLLVLLSFTVDLGDYRYLVYGLNIGYISHIIADVMTKSGCPILWPLTKKKIHLINIKTGSKGERVVACLLIGGILCLGFII